jgi:HEAT repeat protein
MLRATRASAALIRSLLLGTAAVTSTVAVSSILVGCKDENQPEYWLEKMEDVKWRPRAVKRLTQFLDDSMTKAGGKKDDPAVKALEGKLVGPLTDAYVKNYAELDTSTRVNLIKLLADFRDERTLPALKAAFEEFAKKPKKTTDESDIKWAARAYADMKSKELAPSVMKAFEKLEAHTQLGGITYRDYNEAMVAASSAEWSGALIQMLGHEMKDPATAKSKEAARDMIDPFRDEQFWQMTAAQILGELKDPNAVEPLLKVLLTPGKSSIATTALLALVKIGKPSVDRAVKILNESDPLVAFHKAEIKKAGGEEPKGNPALAIAAAVIGMTGRSEGIAPLIATLESKIEDADKALLARELAKIPATAESKAAFQKAYEALPLSAQVQGNTALAVLAEAAGQFADPTMVDWLLQMADKAKGGEEATQVQQGLVMTAIKIAKAEQWDKISAAASKYKVEDLSKGATAIIKHCGDKVACYLDEIQKSDNQSQANQLAGIKAGYMIAVLGDASARDKLIGGLDAIDQAAVRFVAAQAIDKLTPKGDPAVVEKLDAIIAKNKKSADREKAAGDEPLKQISYRISSR